MSRKKSSTKSSVTAEKRQKTRRRQLLAALLATPVAGVGAVWIHKYDVTQRELSDYSVIGSGAPVVVQIHDPGCRLCRQLQGSTETALESFPQIEYRVANIKTGSGAEFQSKYNVPHVTLLLFDGRGKHVDTVQGVTPATELRTRFRTVFDLI